MREPTCVGIIAQYNSSFVAHRQILSKEDKQMLRKLCARYTQAQFRVDVRNYEGMKVDFVYTSAKIEGNTYDRIDNDNLLRMRVTAEGKRFSDTGTLVNLHDGFTKVMAIESNTQLNIDFLCNLHKVLMKDLLPSGEQGVVRTSAVHIGASNYMPLANAAGFQA